MIETVFPPVLPGMAELCQLPDDKLRARFRLLAGYLFGRNDRAQVLAGICNRIDAEGRITDEARLHITDYHRPFRRMVLRGAMVALGLKLPAWLHETEEARAANSDWREQYLLSRKAARLAA